MQKHSVIIFIEQIAAFYQVLIVAWPRLSQFRNWKDEVLIVIHNTNVSNEYSNGYCDLKLRLKALKKYHSDKDIPLIAPS